MNDPFQSFPKWLYHRKHGGRVFNSPKETKWLWLMGWRERPFPPEKDGINSKMRSWWANWEWLFRAVGAVLVIIAAAIGVNRVW